MPVVEPPLARHLPSSACYQSTLILAGEGEDRGSVEDLAAAIPTAELLPGDHGTVERSPELAEAMLKFLSRRR